MTRIIPVILLCCFFFASRAQTGSLIVVVKGIRVGKGGELSTGLFKRENFPKVGKQFLGGENPITDKEEIKILFEKVPVGEYAVVSFQDIDQDKKLKSNLVGYPTEPIGFSRDARIRFGPPDFDDASITLLENQTLTVNINLR